MGNGYKIKHLNYLFPLALVVFFGYSCANNRGETIHVQEYEEFSGYTVYIRDAEPVQPSTYLTRKSAIKPSVNIKSEQEYDRPYSSLYYYRSSNPNRLTRVRLRRFY